MSVNMYIFETTVRMELLASSDNLSDAEKTFLDTPIGALIGKKDDVKVSRLRRVE